MRTRAWLGLGLGLGLGPGLWLEALRSSRLGSEHLLGVARHVLGRPVPVVAVVAVRALLHDPSLVTLTHLGHDSQIRRAAVRSAAASTCFGAQHALVGWGFNDVTLRVGMAETRNLPAPGLLPRGTPCLVGPRPLAPPGAPHTWREAGVRVALGVAGSGSASGVGGLGLAQGWSSGWCWAWAWGAPHT